MTRSWIAVAAAVLSGLLTSLVPVVAYGLAYFFTVGNNAYGNRELLIVAGVATFLTAAIPLAAMGWSRWHQGMAAFAIGMLVGLGPLVAFLAWFSSYLR